MCEAWMTHLQTEICQHLHIVQASMHPDFFFVFPIEGEFCACFFIYLFAPV